VVAEEVVTRGREVLGQIRVLELVRLRPRRLDPSVERDPGDQRREDETGDRERRRALRVERLAQP
jgi:hypothetical protein